MNKKIATPPLDELVYIGIVISAHGIKGQVKIRTFTESPKDITSFTEILDDEGRPIRLSISSVNPSYVIAKINDISTRDEAESLQGFTLHVNRSTLPKPKEGEYYYEDLVGLEVHYTTGEIAGKVKSVENFGASDILEISPNNGADFYYPFHRDFIHSVDLSESTIIVEKLIDLIPKTNITKIITIDGPSAAGKGTIAKNIAKRLGFSYLDTGLMYRMLAHIALSTNTTLSNIHSLISLAKTLDYSGASDGTRSNIYQTEEVSSAASKIAQLSEVREVLNQIQKDFPIGKKGVVIDGRDIGSVIFPDATCKLYITASIEVRAARRLSQIENPNTSLEEVKEKLQERDKRDTMRNVSPLVIPQGAIVLDTSDLTVEESCELAYKKARSITKTTFNQSN